MKLRINWGRMVRLKKTRDATSYHLDLAKVTAGAGVYIFGRKWHTQFEALYVGKAGNIRSRVKGHLDRVRLMRHLRDAKDGNRIVLAGNIALRPGQKQGKCLLLAEKALIRHFLSEGDDLANKMGTKIQRHELESSGRHPKRFFPKTIYLERSKGG